MGKICDLTNHVFTFKESWGVCGALVCSWLSKMKKDEEVNNQDDLGPTGSIILVQHKAMSENNEDEGKKKVFKHYDLTKIQKETYNAAGGGTLYDHDNFAIAAAKEGLNYLSLCWLGEDDSENQHAIGVFVKDFKIFLCDPNFGIWECENLDEFKDVYLSIARDKYDVLSGSIYRLT